MFTSATDTILFDLGGLIEHVNPNRVVEAFKQLGMQDPKRFFTLHAQSAICNEFEKGNVGADTFIDHILKHCRKGTAEQDVINAWNANLLGVPLKALGSLQSLHNQGFSLYILSNTNEIHVKKIIENFYRQYRLDFYSLFTNVYFSYEIGHRKPETQFFKHVLNDANLSAKQCVFVDDLAKNLEPAKKLGINVIKHQTNEPIQYLATLHRSKHALDELCASRDSA